jgi:hypothetical protein
MSLENWETSGNSLTTNYYLVVINPELHRQVWNTLKLTMVIAEVEWVLFYDNTINTIHMEEVNYEQYRSYNYSLN